MNVNGIFSSIGDLIRNIISSVLDLLPSSPFQALQRSIDVSPFMGALNWIVPFGTFVSILQAWLTAIAVWYVWRLVLRWVKAVE